MGLMGALHPFAAGRAEPIPDPASARAYRCRECDNEVRVDAVQSLSRCLVCKGCSWESAETAPEPVVSRIGRQEKTGD